MWLILLHLDRYLFTLFDLIVDLLSNFWSNLLARKLEHHITHTALHTDSDFAPYQLEKPLELVDTKHASSFACFTLLLLKAPLFGSFADHAGQHSWLTSSHGEIFLSGIFLDIFGFHVHADDHDTRITLLWILFFTVLIEVVSVTTHVTRVAVVESLSLELSHLVDGTSLLKNGISVLGHHAHHLVVADPRGSVLKWRRTDSILDLIEF